MAMTTLRISTGRSNLSSWRLVFFGLMLSAAASPLQAQDAEDWNHPAAKGERKIPRLQLPTDSSDLTIYETELRYRKIVQMIGFVLFLGVLHLVQVKLKINRAYFWFVVGFVILGLVLNSYLPRYDPIPPRSPSDVPPKYAPTHAR